MFPRIATTILTILLFCITNSLKYSTQIQAGERFCFYQIFEAHQKYAFSASAKQQAGRYQVEVAHIHDRSWKTIYHQSSHNQNQKKWRRIRVDKMASIASTYSFCVVNTHNIANNIYIEFSSGLDMMELTNLPDKSDSQNMERELNWLQQQLNQMDQKSESIEEFRRMNSQIQGLVGIKMIVFGIIGLIGIASVNVAFYKLLKNQLKKRKFI